MQRSYVNACIIELWREKTARQDRRKEGGLTLVTECDAGSDDDSWPAGGNFQEKGANHMSRGWCDRCNEGCGHVGRKVTESGVISQVTQGRVISASWRVRWYKEMRRGKALSLALDLCSGGHVSSWCRRCVRCAVEVEIGTVSSLNCFSELLVHSQCRDATALGLVDRVRLHLLEYSIRRKDRRNRGEYWERVRHGFLSCAMRWSSEGLTSILCTGFIAIVRLAYGYRLCLWERRTVLLK